VITIGGEVMKVGVCEGCKMRGLLRERPVVPPANIVAALTYLDDPLATLMLCITCFETPAGCVSENLKRR